MTEDTISNLTINHKFSDRIDIGDFLGVLVQVEQVQSLKRKPLYIRPSRRHKQRI